MRGYSKIDHELWVLVLFKKIVELIINVFKRFEQLIKFSFVGILNTLIDFAVFFVGFYLFKLGYSISQAAGYICGMINSFLLNKSWTFEDKSNNKLIIKAIKFSIVNIVSLGVSIYAINFFAKKLFLNVFFSKIFATVLAQGINFIGYKFWVFKK